MKQILKMQNFLDQRMINLRIDFFYKVLDTPMSELERRSKAYVTLSTDFGFLNKIFSFM